jgi:hypothetical protein
LSLARQERITAFTENPSASAGAILVGFKLSDFGSRSGHVTDVAQWMRRKRGEIREKPFRARAVNISRHNGEIIRHKKTAPEEIPRGGVVFLVTALPTVRGGHEVNHDHSQPGDCDSGDSQHDVSSFLFRLKRRCRPVPPSSPGDFNQRQDGNPATIPSPSKIVPFSPNASCGINRRYYLTINA